MSRREQLADQLGHITVPDLPPGKYVRNVAAGMYGVDGTAPIRSQPFTVGDNCAKD